MKKYTHILPHTMLLIGGRIVFLISAAIIPILWIVFFSNLPNLPIEEIIVSFISLILFTVLLGVCVAYMIRVFWHQIFGEILITQEEVIFFGLFIPTIRIKFDNIRFVDIITFDEGNVYYRDIKENVDFYKFILISENPLPQKRIDKIFSSKKNKLIKYAVSKKLCYALVDKLPEMQARIIDHQLMLYKRAKNK